MFFYVDETGHTGLELFDPVQPTLYYGVLSGPADLDVVALKKVQEMRRRLGVSRIHAKDLGSEKLAVIAGAVLNVMRKLRLKFDIYKVAKADHAIISFFDQIFDSGMNQAVRWSNYWTPLRYALLFEVAALFDEELAKRAWNARKEGNDAKGAQLMQSVCEELMKRLDDIQSDQARKRVGDALTWAIRNPEAISYNASNEHLPKKEKKSPAQQISPNIIGFQLVMKGIANRLMEGKVEASRIVVDQQGEFNNAQNTLAEFFAAASGQEFLSGPGMPTFNFDCMPTIPILYQSGDSSVGLELVDILLWVHRRYFEGKPIAKELIRLIAYNAPKGMTDEISLQAIWDRWQPVLVKTGSSLEDLSPEALTAAKEMIAKEDERIATALAMPSISS